MAAKELRAIIEAQAAARRRGEPGALVTVVKTAGSTYRRAGARMFVDASGSSVGSISGGCLEEDARERALESIALGQPRTLRYDTTSDGDIVWGSGLGCNGVVHVLIEPQPVRLADTGPLAAIGRTLERRRRGALASIFAGPEDQLGGYLWISDDSLSPAPETSIEDPVLRATLLADTRTALAAGRPRVHAYGGGIEAFVDVVAPARGLMIFGAGHDAGPLARLAKELGWRVRVIDGRRAYAIRERFPEANDVIHCPPAAVGERIAIEPGEAAVIMTHNYLSDLEIVRALLASPAGYIGLLGPRRRKERLLTDLARIARPTPRSLRRVHGPAGLDIGAETPEEIALSILAEIEAVGARRQGGSLRRRQGPLHDPLAAPAEQCAPEVAAAA